MGALSAFWARVLQIGALSHSAFDKVRLVDGRKVRLAGINAPEVAHQGKPAEPLGDEARDLSHLLESDNHLLMRLELDRMVQYGWLLAHLYQMDGSSIDGQLLRKGLVQQPRNNCCFATVRI